MIITDIKRFIPEVKKYYNHYGDIIDMQHFKLKTNGYFVITTKVKQFKHLRIFRDDVQPNIIYSFNIGDIKNIMQLQFGNPSIGLYVLPKQDDKICGLTPEHIFSYDDIYRDFKSTFYKTSKFDTVIKSFTQYNPDTNETIGNFKVMQIPSRDGFKYCNYTTAKESFFNFYCLQDVKDISMNMPMTPMVIPINTGIKDNSNIKILPWNPINLPNLKTLYKYNKKTILNPPAIQNILMNALSKSSKQKSE